MGGVYYFHFFCPRNPQYDLRATTPHGAWPKRTTWEMRGHSGKIRLWHLRFRLWAIDHRRRRIVAGERLAKTKSLATCRTCAGQTCGRRIHTRVYDGPITSPIFHPSSCRRTI